MPDSWARLGFTALGENGLNWILMEGSKAHLLVKHCFTNGTMGHQIKVLTSIQLVTVVSNVCRTCGKD